MFFYKKHIIIYIIYIYIIYLKQRLECRLRASSWPWPAMAAAEFLTESADTPGVKHLFSPLVLHIGASQLQNELHKHGTLPYL